MTEKAVPRRPSKRVRSKKPARPGLLDRLALRNSVSRTVDGLWIGIGAPVADKDEERLFSRVEEALRLIQTHDPIRYARALRDLDRVWVQLLTQTGAEYRYALNACILDPRYVGDENATIEEIASTIVHEACHARLWHHGIGYEEHERKRVEAVCSRREIAFAAKLPAGGTSRAQAEKALTYPPDTWADTAFRERDNKGRVEAMRHIGVPPWLIQTGEVVRPAVLGVKRIVWRLRALLRRVI